MDISFKMTKQVEQWIFIKFHIKIKHSSMETIQMIQKAKLWPTGDWQLHHNNVPAHALCLMQSFLLTHQITQMTQPLYSPDLTACNFWVFPKTKITFEREEISDHWQHSGQYNGASNGDWEYCVRSQGAYFEGDGDVIVLCTMFFVSCIFFNECLHFSYYMDGYFLDRPHNIELQM